MDTHLQTLLRYLHAVASMAWRCVPEGVDTQYSGSYDYVLDRGQRYDCSQPLTVDERAIVEHAIAKAHCGFRTKECFPNAQRLVLADHKHGRGELVYVEGFAIGHGMIPVLHAWASLRGKVVDLTWRDECFADNPKLYEQPLPAPAHRILGRAPEGFAYYGVEFLADTIVERMLTHGAWWSFLDGAPDVMEQLRQPRRHPRSVLSEAT